MTSHKCVAALMLLIGLFWAFNLTDYLYPAEQNASVEYTNFSINGTTYSIVAISGTDTFLLKNGEPVTNASQIDSIVYTYYVRTYYPGQEDIDELKGLIQKFNASRNDGYDYKNKEEYLCRDDVLLSNGKITVSGKPVKCVDNESCTRNAMLLFSVYGEGLGLGSPSVIIGPLSNFTPISLGMDWLLSNYTSKLDSMDENSVSDTLSYIRDSSVGLKNMSMAIESTVFRTPRLNDSQDRKDCQFKCWAICPSFDLDQASAQSIHDKAEEMASQLGPLEGFGDTSAGIYSRTTERMEHLRQENMEEYYLDVFSPLNRTGADAISSAEESLSHVLNRSLTDKLDTLKSLHATIPEDISSHNFTGLDDDISLYQELSGDVSEGSAFLDSVYNRTKSAKNAENSLLIILETKDLDPVSMNSLELMRNQSADLDAQFHDGLTLAQLEGLESNYTALKLRAQDLLKVESDTPSTRMLLLFRGFARKINTGIAHFAERTDMMPKSEIPDSPATLGVFSLLFFLSFSSLVMLAFLYIFSSRRFSVPRTSHILVAAFISIIALLFVFSLMLYLFLGKTSTDATLPEFLADFNSKNSTSVFLDLRDASLSDAQAMRSCAAMMTESFESKNKTWSLYTITPNTCSLASESGANSSLTPDECLEARNLADSSFLLGYSAKTEPARLSVIYRNQADIKANLDYYESCPIVALFG